MPAFTSVSLMSTSAWNGPGGSPIVSPSRWNALVANNLAVIGNHNHTASAGEGASTIFSACYFPSLDVQYIYPWFPVTNTGWVMENRADWPGMGCISTSTLGAILEYDTYIRPGTWKFSWITGQGANFGKIAACIGSSPISFQLGDIGDGLGTDRYLAGTGASEYIYGPGGAVSGCYTYSLAYNLESITIGANAGNGRTKLKFKVTGKNDDSQGYIIKIGYMMLYRS